MATTFELIFENHSNKSGDFIIFKKSPSNVNDPSLAWISQPTNPNTKAEFQWELDYSVMWLEKREENSVTITTSQVVPIGLDKQNKITLTKNNNAYQFVNQTTDENNLGNIDIYSDNTVKPNEVTIAVCLSKKIIMQTQASPGFNSTFSFSEEYWIAFSDCKKGEVIDATTLEKAVPVTYPTGILSMIIMLNADDTWTIAPTQ